MSFDTEVTFKKRLTEAEKKRNDFQYYKEQANLLDSGGAMGNASFISFGEVTDYKRKKVNYDLFNNIVNLADLTYVTSPYGTDVGELPANLTNRDIVSGKIKVLLGMEMDMPFSWRIVAVNREATTRKEEAFFGKIKDFVNNQIMAPIQVQAEQQAMAQFKGRELTEQEKQQVQKQIDAQTKKMTPDEVIKYMSRKHQDPAEVQATQILEYLIRTEQINDKFNKGFKHGLLSGLEAYGIFVWSKKPKLEVVNSLHFEYDKSPDLDDISEGEWAKYELRMTPTQIIANFGHELTEDEIDRIYNYRISPSYIADSDFTFDTTRADERNTIRVIHLTWKGLKKVGFLRYMDRNGEEQLTIVGEEYKLDKLNGDLGIEWEWIPIGEQCYKIMNDIFVQCGVVPGQIKDIDDLWEAKLPYCGGTYDNMNSVMTSAMDRIKSYQYLFNIILYRIELLMASDKGKILAANINAIPKSAGVDIKKWTYFLEANHIAWYNPKEEGKKGAVGGDANSLFKEIDMSLVSNIQNYISIAEYIERKCGTAIGVTPQMEAQIGATEAVTNTKQNLIQSSHIVRPYFETHSTIKRNTLQQLLDTAKTSYVENPPEYLSYVMDDQTVAMFSIDVDMLSSSTLGLFVSNSVKDDQAKKQVEQLAEAALQQQKAELSDIIRVLRADNINEAEELMEVADQKRKEMEQENAQAEQDAKAQEEEAARAHEKEKWAHEKDMMVTKENMTTDREIKKAAVVAIGFDTEKDMNDNGQPDALDVANHMLNTEVKLRDQNLKEQKFAHEKEMDGHQKKVDEKSLDLEQQKIKKMGNKPKTS